MLISVTIPIIRSFLQMDPIFNIVTLMELEILFLTDSEIKNENTTFKIIIAYFV